MTPDVRERLYAMPGMIGRDEGERLAELAAMVPPEYAIVELGSAAGLSACWLAHGSTGAHVTCIDPWEPLWSDADDPLHLGLTGYLDAFLANITLERLWSCITPLRARSTDIAPLWLQPVGLLWIDANHEYEHVREDYEAWAPLVPPGGWIAFHDFGDTYPDVAAVIDQVVLPSGWWERAPLVSAVWSARRVAP
jgi:MMP 1-O-methyltransferase